MFHTVNANCKNCGRFGPVNDDWFCEKCSRAKDRKKKEERAKKRAEKRARKGGKKTWRK